MTSEHDLSRVKRAERWALVEWIVVGGRRWWLLLLLVAMAAVSTRSESFMRMAFRVCGPTNCGRSSDAEKNCPNHAARCLDVFVNGGLKND
ncbi:MAG TPA: hypothetical protein VK680_02640 [Solirubrobacteraceae bacterium]|nr:hypothetical protein [Solirubrobacteraceae bacterium]